MSHFEKYEKWARFVFKDVNFHSKHKKKYWYNFEYFWRENSNLWNIFDINRRKWDILAIFKHCREGREMGELTIFILSNFDAISQCFVINAFGFIFQAFFFFDDKIDLADSFMNK